MAKRALCVGINYPGTSYELNGCVNDVRLMEGILQQHFEFTDITLLLDNDATTDNIVSELKKLVKDAQPGDILYFHYSGHGSQVLDTNNEESDGLDEIICPVDLNWKDKIIKDDDLKRIFDPVPEGVNLTVMLDSCHSGGGLDQLNEYQYIEDGKAVPPSGGRFLPPPNMQEMLLLEKRIGFKKRTVQRDVNKTSMLISGCESNQTSADAYINGKYQGAATYACSVALNNSNYNLSYKELVDKMNTWLIDNHFTQHPELNGSSALYDHKFLSSYQTGSVDDSEEVDRRPIKPKSTCSRCHKLRGKCSCERKWKRQFWGTNRWRIYYNNQLRKWRIELRKWKRQHH